MLDAAAVGSLIPALVVSSPGDRVPFSAALLSVGGAIAFMVSGHCVHLKRQF
jgi:hypothetical protein